MRIYKYLLSVIMIVVIVAGFTVIGDYVVDSESKDLDFWVGSGISNGDVPLTDALKSEYKRFKDKFAAWGYFKNNDFNVMLNVLSGSGYIDYGEIDIPQEVKISSGAYMADDSLTNIPCASYENYVVFAVGDELQFYDSTTRELALTYPKMDNPSHLLYHDGKIVNIMEKNNEFYFHWYDGETLLIRLSNSLNFTAKFCGLEIDFKRGEL